MERKVKQNILPKNIRSMKRYSLTIIARSRINIKIDKTETIESDDLLEIAGKIPFILLRIMKDDCEMYHKDLTKEDIDDIPF